MEKSITTQRRNWPKTLFIWFVLASTITYLGIIAYLMLNQTNMIYHPEGRQVAIPAARFSLHEQRVSYPSTDGVQLTAWIIPAVAQQNAEAMWMLICHGNLGNIGFGQRPEFYSFMRDTGLNLFAFDYRGYGDSTGSPNELGLYADALASYHYLTKTLHISPDHIIIFGHSLGSGVAIELASKVPAAALIVEGAYTSVAQRGQELYPMLPIALVSTQRFPSIERIGSIKMPKLLIHSPEDSIIPYAHGQRLYAAADSAKRFVDVKGGHQNAYSVDKAKYYGAIAQLMREVTPETSTTVGY
jgi:pimeloyl-ACP methyl ester carboxylesterase